MSSKGWWVWRLYILTARLFYIVIFYKIGFWLYLSVYEEVLKWKTQAEVQKQRNYKEKEGIVEKIEDEVNLSVESKAN